MELTTSQKKFPRKSHLRVETNVIVINIGQKGLNICWFHVSRPNIITKPHFPDFQTLVL